MFFYLFIVFFGIPYQFCEGQILMYRRSYRGGTHCSPRVGVDSRVLPPMHMDSPAASFLPDSEELHREVVARAEVQIISCRS